MDPFSFLKEECQSVRGTLKETLRHDYGPNRSQPFFDECAARLGSIEQAIQDDPEMDRDTVATHLHALGSLGSRISLIERSHLGEFSWPFSSVIEKIADTMLVEETVYGPKAPIVHIIAEGMDYQIVDDEIPENGLRRIIVVAFPRQLKHYVLLHAIFGHELAHVAISAEKSGFFIKSNIMPILREDKLQDCVQLKGWLSRSDAPENIIEQFRSNPDFEFTEKSVENWRQEIVCDLFGLMLFGPAFVAAHRTIIEALCKKRDSFSFENSTHPPFIIRQRVLAQAMRALNWHLPQTKDAASPIGAAERRMFDYVLESNHDDWSQVLSNNQVERLVQGFLNLFKPYGGLVYTPPKEETLLALVDRLSRERPPIWQSINKVGKPSNHQVMIPHYLYAGWTFWFGRRELSATVRARDPSIDEPTFLEINRLCDHAILQHKAIDISRGGRK